MIVEILFYLLLIDIGQQPSDGLEHEDQDQQDGVLQEANSLF
jgi:hypothetical protein